MISMHVVPLRDVVEHDVPGGLDGHEAHPKAWLGIEALDGDDSACVCGPRVEHVPSEDDGPGGWLVVHHSLDGREAIERSEATS